MANDSKPPVHDKLRTYAAERRRQMGALWMLPPDIRRRLLAAVEGQAGAGNGGSVQRLLGWLADWPRWRWAAAVSSAVAVAGGLWLAIGPRVSPPAQLAQYNHRATNEPTIAPPPASPATRVASPPAVVPDGGTRPHSLPGSRSVPQPTASPESAVWSSPAAAAGVRQKDHLERMPLATSPAPRSAATSTVVFAPASKAPLALTRLEPTAAQSFRRVAPVRQGDPKAADAVRPAMLDHFRLESVGNTFRIIDADGSVYEGIVSVGTPATPLAAGVAYVRPTGPQPAPVAARGVTDLRYGLPARSGRLVEQASWESNATVSRGGEFGFEVSGTNRPTGQAVQIRGTLVVTNRSALESAATAQRTNNGGESLQFLLQNAVVRAQAVLGGRQTSSVEAVPAQR